MVLLNPLNINRKPINEDEMAFLRLFAHGFSIRQIKDFLEINTIAIVQIRRRIEFVFNSNDWAVILKKAFQYKMLDVNDYVKDDIKEITNKFTKTIYSDFFPLNKSNTPKSLENGILDYYESCKDALKIDYIKLDSRELIYLDYKLQKRWVQYERLINPNYTTEEERLIERSIQLKLNANNFYNVIRNAFELNIIDRNNYLTISVEDQVNKVSNEIKNIESLKRLALKEKRANIYNLLLSFYNNVEYNYLLNET